MKYIVIGLGRYGSKLAVVLSEMGHEVIGVDSNDERCDEVKDSIATAIRMDTTNINAIKSLPVDDVDAVIVTIGEDVGASILTLSVLKNLKISRIIGRAVNQVHFNILKQIGIEEVVLPLEDSAVQLASMLQLWKVKKIYELGNDNAIVEVDVPLKYAGHNIDTLNITERFRLKLVAIKSRRDDNIISTVFRTQYTVDLFKSPDYILLETDLLVIAGKMKDIKRFIDRDII